MLARILHNSPQLCTFLAQLNLNLYEPQRRHMLNLADALLVCEDKKTLAALQRQFMEAPDAANMADFLRISPWQAQDVRAALRAQQVAPQRNEQRRPERSTSTSTIRWARKTRIRAIWSQ
jgi:hypothetical protein